MMGIRGPKHAEEIFIVAPRIVAIITVQSNSCTYIHFKTLKNLLKTFW